MSGRGNRTLDQYDQSRDASPQARWERTLARRDNREPSTRTADAIGGGGGCWCGSPFGHDWPGKADGAPHPRDWPGRVNGHGFRS